MRRVADWLPVAGIVLGYRAAGWISGRLDRPRADELLAGWDGAVFGGDPCAWLQQSLPGAALEGLELFYLSYYLLIPLAPALLWSRHGRQALWRLWVPLCLSYLVCDLLFPWFPSQPPRARWPGAFQGGPGRELNRMILDRFSVGGNVFPSSHAAAAVCLALSHLRYSRRLGLLFLVWAAGIGLSTVSGGYHYGVDAAAGVLVAVLAHAASAKMVLWRR